MKLLHNEKSTALNFTPQMTWEFIQLRRQFPTKSLVSNSDFRNIHHHMLFYVINNMSKFVSKCIFWDPFSRPPLCPVGRVLNKIRHSVKNIFYCPLSGFWYLHYGLVCMKCVKCYISGMGRQCIDLWHSLDWLYYDNYIRVTVIN